MPGKHILHAFTALAFLLASVPVNGQTNTEVFGQNRVQYRDYNWKFFDTKHFRVYHYDRSGITLARYVCEQAEQDIPLMERKLGGKFPDRFNIFLYNNYDEYRQTNIGLKMESQFQDISTGTFNLVDDKLLVYFNGVHTDLRRQIRLGIVKVMMQHQLFGNDARSIAKNALSQAMPQWTIDGYVAYVVDGWDPKSESEWKNRLDAQPRAGFYTLAEKYPELAGKAFWKYVADRYGEESIMNVLRTMQENSNLNKGIRRALKMKVRPVYDSCIAYYKKAFAQDLLVQETPDSSTGLISIKVPRDGRMIRNMRISPKGRDIVYCEFKEGEYKIYIQRTGQQQERSLILATGRPDWNELTPDADYPLLAWSNNGYKIAILYRYKRQTRLRIYNALKAKIENYIIPPNRFDRVLGMTFNETDDKLIFSAIKKSQTDLYLFTLRGSRMTNITNDPWDDTQPWFVSGGGRKGILFLSNRPKPNLNVPAEINELPTGPMNVFFYDTKTESPVLMKCSDNAGGNLTQPIQYGANNFAYLLDTNGIQNKYVVVFGRDVNNMDSAISVPVTNYSRSILSHQYNPASNQVADVLQMGDEYKVFFSPMLIPGENVTPKILQKTTLSATRNQTTPLTGSVPKTAEPAGRIVTDSSAPIIRSGDVFQTEFAEDTTAEAVTNVPQVNEAAPAVVQGKKDTSLLLDPTIKDSTYLQLRAQPYRLSFKPDFVSVRLDNTVLFSKYQPAAFNGNQFSNPPLGGLITVSLNDALENQRFTGGLRIPTNFNEGMTWFLQYQNFTKRADWGLVFMRSVNVNDYTVRYGDTAGNFLLNDQRGKVVTNLLQGSVSYPLDRIRRVGFHLGVRQDALNFQAQDSLSLLYTPPNRQYWTMSRLEYVFDNSRSPILNIRFGFRYKVYAEYLYGLSKENNGGFYNVGLDFRYYKQIFRNTIFAARLAAAHSGGDQHMLYLLGGVDNQIGAPANSAPTSQGHRYAFQAQATNLRGYKQNSRSGDSYGLANFELRMPVLTTLLQRPIQSNFLRSLQLVGFMDAGAAWDGIVPNGDNLAKNIPYVNNTGAVIATVKYSPGFALGYGGGIRASLLSYFMRLDAAWNIDGATKPIMYFSIGTDF